MGPKSTAGKSSKGKADDSKSTKSKVSQKKRPPSVAKSQMSKADAADDASTQHEKVKSQTSQRYEDNKDEEEVVRDQLDVNANSPGEENINDEDDLGLKEQTTKGMHLQSELDGQLNSMHGTMRNANIDDPDALILEEGVADNATDYKAKQDVDKKSEVNDEAGVLGDRNEIIQPMVKNQGISEDEVLHVKKAWNDLLVKGELMIGKVLFKNLFTISPQTIALFTQDATKDQKSLFSDEAFLDEIEKVVKAIGKSINSLSDIDQMIPALNDFGDELCERGVVQDYYGAFGRSLHQTLKAGLRQGYTYEIQQAVTNVWTVFSKHLQYEWYNNPQLRDNTLTFDRIQMVQSTWIKTKNDLSPEDIGDQIFQNIFAVIPESLHSLPFGSDPNYRQSQAYQDHNCRLVATLNNAVENLQNMDQLIPVLKELGNKHFLWNVKKEWFPVAIDAVIKVFQDHQANQLTTPIRKAWRIVLKNATSVMLSDHYDNDLSQERIQLVQNSWAVIKNDLSPEIIGDQIFQNIFSVKEEALQYLSFGSDPNYRQSSAYKEHNCRLVATLNNAVENLNNLGDLIPILKELGNKHFVWGVRKDYFPVAINAIIKVFQDHLVQDFTEPMKKAWSVVLKTAVEVMLSDHYDNDLTPERIQLVQNSWAKAKDLGFEAVGDAVFQNIFAAAPQVLKMFSFGKRADYQQTQMYEDHTVKVAQTLSTAVESLHNIDELIPILQGLGADHFAKGVQKEHYPIVMKAVIKTLEDNLGSQFTQQHKLAWQAVLNKIQELMVDENYNLTLTPERVQLVQKSWANVKDLGYVAVGDALFQNIFAAAPQVLKMFSFGNRADYQSTQAYEDHSVKVVSTLSTAIENLHKIDELIPILQSLGAEHVPRGVRKDHYPVVMNAVIQTLKENLGSQFTPQCERAWQAVLNTVQNFMISNNYDTLPEDEAEKLLNPYQKGDTYRQMDSYAITVQDTERNENLKASMSMRSDRNEDTMRPINQGNEEGMKLEDIGKSKTQREKDEIFDNYATLFRKEVDFHHKVAYRFEKAYRLGKKTSDRKQSLNLEIIDCISEHSGYIEQDPMALFYCLFFCIYFKNEDLVEFLRNLIGKIESNSKISQLLKYIDEEGLEKIRTVGEQINQIVYHMVFYQAIDDKLRIVYTQILRQLKMLQMRDQDALHLLNTRDYEMIRMTFEKHTTKIDLKLFGIENASVKCSTYRKYNQAYYEEIVITSKNVEERVAQNYRERFLVTADDIYIVFDMYCKEDYDDQFLKTRKDEITHQQFIDLFIRCIQNDSYQIAMYIYTLFLNVQTDIDNRIMDILMGTIKDSILYHEYKLFLIHEHFDIMTISQMNHLVDIYQEILHSKEPKGNPLISQYNVIKVALLIYRICWKIEKKQIYSLITKCQLLQNYLVTTLCAYFERCNNILILYKFMSEPILHMSERKDCLDIMYEMNMQKLLQHPVVVEVLNLVYEGKYSVSSSSLSMSQTFQCAIEMDTMSLKSINEKLIQNVVNFGDTGSQKQTSLQYNIWKQSILQRQFDEMTFTTIFSFVIIYFGIIINIGINFTYLSDVDFFGYDIARHQNKILTFDEQTIKDFCAADIPVYVDLHGTIQIFTSLIIMMSIGMFTSVCQKILVFKTKDNVTLQFGQILLELVCCITSVLYVVCIYTDQTTTVIGDTCQKFAGIDDTTKNKANISISLCETRDGELSFNLLISALIVETTFLAIIMLQRTQYLGELIMMLDQMKDELSKFFLTFGLIIVVFLLLGRMLSTEFKYEPVSFFYAFIDLFNAFNGNIRFSMWTHFAGEVYIVIFMYIFKILLMSLLAAMFINRYKTVWVNLDAYRRFTIIKLKNQVSYDKFIGGVTLTFFPINILMLPFSLILTALRSKRASDIMLKIQYAVMMVLYCFLAAILFIPAIPILISKLYANSLFIFFTNQREQYKGENIVQLLLTIFLGPILMMLSIIIDLLSLPNVLLKESTNFEHKYQLSADRLNDAQIDVVMVTFGKIFYDRQSWEGFKNQHMTLIELMKMHRIIFSLIDNLHDLFCRGNKDYKQALSNVQDYNMTKILTRQCSIPDINGDYKESKCDLNTIYAVQFDIERYNYIDVVLRKLRMGILREEVLNKEKGIKSNQHDEAASGNAKDLDDDDDELKKVDGVFPIGIGPDGAPLKRNNSDVMNNFFILYAVKTFTEIEKMIKNQNTQDSRAQAKFINEVEKKKVTWEEKTIGQFDVQSNNYEAYINGSLGIKKQDAIDDQAGGRVVKSQGSDKQKTASTHSSKDKDGQ